MIYWDNVFLPSIVGGAEKSVIWDNKIRNTVTYYEIPLAFDIETTSTYDTHGNKITFMYEWTVGVNGNAFYGRNIDELKTMLNNLRKFLMLSDNQRVLIYVHNLGYEFQFIRKYFNWQDVFAVEERKPIKAVTNGIEFRDSYILSGYSLAKTADNLQKHTIKKLDGELDYGKIRHEKTVLTENELNYCENDVLIITAYISEQIEIYGSITKIPLTNTGRVRKFVRSNCYPTKKQKRNSQWYRELMLECSLDLKSYVYCKKSFSGGFVHASLAHVGKTLHDVHSIDFNSSYPYCMVSEKYPMSRPYYTTDPDDLLSGEFLSIFCVEFYAIQSRFTYDSYLSRHKCVCVNDRTQNGKIYYADYVKTWITNIDYEIIKRVYVFSDMKVIDGYYFYKQYLPRQIIDSILKLYNNKTELKGVKGKEIEYLLSKGMLNSVYGMSVTDIVRDSFIYDDGWEIEKITKETAEKGIEQSNKSRNRFLYYPWGVFVTAYARKNLWNGILRIEKDYVYSDTDSIKFFNYGNYRSWIDDYNSNCVDKLKKMCKFRKIDFEMCKPMGRVLGVFDYEGVSDCFKTLGAKRYMTYSRKDGYKLTVAGLSKQNGMDYIRSIGQDDTEKIFNLFNDDLIIPSNATGKQTHTYIDDTMECDITDYNGGVFHVKQLSGIHLSECEYNMKVSDHYIDFIKAYREGYILKRGLYGN